LLDDLEEPERRSGQPGKGGQHEQHHPAHLFRQIDGESSDTRNAFHATPSSYLLT
jgi:hypothetical protein